MNEADVVTQQDQQRTARAFISFLSTAMGTDQAIPGQDGSAVNSPYRYQVIGPTGVGVEGAPISTAQPVAGGVQISSGVLLVAAVLAAIVIIHH